jgi:hypothetical protein
MTLASVTIQVDPGSAPSPPAWLEEVATFAHILTHVGILSAITEQVHFARARFGLYETLDFVLVLLCYAISGEPTLKAFYERLAPFTQIYLLLFGRKQLPSRSTLSRFLAALDEPTVEALRREFQIDLLARKPLLPTPAGMWDRQDQHWVVVDVDGTRQPARQRALPTLETLPEPHRRLTQVCEKGYTGRKRGEVVRTRTVVLQAHTQQWLGTFGAPGNGELRAHLLRACQVAVNYAVSQQLHPSQILIRLDGGYGDTLVMNDVLALGLGLIGRSRDYALVGRPEIQAALSRPPTCSTHPESGCVRLLYDCPSIVLLPPGPAVRVIIATHPTTNDPPKVGQVRDGLVYELFVSTIAAPALTANDLLDLYRHRGSFETVLADEDREQDPDRWCSRTPCGQEFWQILSQWVWNLRLELGQHLSPVELRTTQWASADQQAPAPEPLFALEQIPIKRSVGTNLSDYGPPQWARASFTGGFPATAFLPQSDGTLLCPAGNVLTLREQREERAHSIRVSYSARIEECNVCPIRHPCLGHPCTFRARRVSAVYWPLPSHPLASSVSRPSRSASPARASVLWRDWPGGQIRRQWIKMGRSQTVEVTDMMVPSPDSSGESTPLVLTRSQRAHWRLSWAQRLARNARCPSSPPVMVTLHGLPAAFAQAYGLLLCPTAS